jgi:predicted RNase H-like nuclease
MPFPKLTPLGMAARIEALTAAIPNAAALAAAPPRGARTDDVLDALAVAWSARRIAAGTAFELGDGTVDARGRPMRIVA